jgi:hypothetical protein
MLTLDMSGKTPSSNFVATCDVSTTKIATSKKLGSI